MKKPYFYPRNRRAPETTHLLLSQNYENYENQLMLYGLIIVTQLKGSLNVKLEPKEFCFDFCKDLNFELFAGESVVFLSHLWTFTYQYSAEKDFTVTFITETDFW